MASPVICALCAGSHEERGCALFGPIVASMAVEPSPAPPQGSRALRQAGAALRQSITLMGQEHRRPGSVGGTLTA